MEKNEEYIVTIEDMTHDGEGVGKVDGYALFVKDAVIGDVAKVKIMKTKKTYGYARLMEIITPSKDRVQAVCPVARQCGGCQLQEMSYEAQLAFKKSIIQNNLERIGGIKDVTVETVLGMDEPFYYRNKAQFPIGLNKDGEIVSGFYAGRTHSIIPADSCAIGVALNAPVLSAVKAYMRANKVKPYDETNHSGLIRHVLIRVGFTTSEVMVCVIANGDKLPNEDDLISRLTALKLPSDIRMKAPKLASIMLNVNKERTNVIMGSKVRTLWGKSYIEDYIGNVKYHISPLSFYQVNPIQTKLLYEKALEFAGLTGTETVWDLYCGIGTISLFLAQKAKKVYGVEIVPQAIEDAKNNAKLNNITNAEFFVGKSEEVLPEFYRKECERTGEKLTADVIVVDPPRKGCEESLLETMVNMTPKRIVYVSCDSATLARDLKYLTANGYRIDRCLGVDQFCMSVHVETVVLMSKVK